MLLLSSIHWFTLLEKGSYALTDIFSPAQAPLFGHFIGQDLVAAATASLRARIVWRSSALCRSGRLMVIQRTRACLSLNTTPLIGHPLYRGGKDRGKTQAGQSHDLRDKDRQATLLF